MMAWHMYVVNVAIKQLLNSLSKTTRQPSILQMSNVSKLAQNCQQIARITIFVTKGTFTVCLLGEIVGTKNGGIVNKRVICSHCKALEIAITSLEDQNMNLLQ